MEKVIHPKQSDIQVGKLVGCGRFINSVFLFNLPDNGRRQLDKLLQIKSLQQDKAIHPGSLIGPNKMNAKQIQPTDPKKTKKVSKYAKQVLSEWFLAHVDNPYANRDERHKISVATGLTDHQIKVWLTNARIRKRSLIPNGIPHYSRGPLRSEDPKKENPPKTAPKA
ncbi:Homeobox domain containing protein [Trichomonas vaginalis G3]|uniref:Homeobox domain containing protein n=1 Tax=Trichomonas vaginalis (strain ATCC PRA-98 / G3) TaxID=412133 RepID=A2EYR9_TRIV3|nr:Homeobox KN domain-containing protein [Trichomonas vaginalis G3]EAY02216.1 Homeobox domain containing protein [Trichomonas vaginalis G3]KAI5501024.1 Homeobox KN domain-containing protein [Trichomonas vaginalis G3]|eukprot:XP_001314554.1 Homeobox domain containing protein [Trichomonas vaginalis G3]